MAEPSYLAYVYVIIVGVTFAISLSIIRLHSNRVTEEELPDIIDVNESFDEVIIDITKERISQELERSSSLETKAGVLIGIIGVIFAIFFSNGWTFYLEIFKTQIYTTIPFILGVTFLIISIISSLLIIRVRMRLRLINPRNANNQFSQFTLAETKRQIKLNLIDNFDIIRREIRRDSDYFTFSFWFFVFGFGCFAAPGIFKAISQLDSIIPK